MRAALLLIAGAVMVGDVPGHARVISSAPGSFEIANEAVVAASPAQVWAALGAPARWWDPAHSWSGDATNLSLDLRAGGCFCERWRGGSAEHMRVVHVEPGRLLRMTGALGPLQAEGVAGAMTVALKPADGGTRVTLRYAVSGYFPGGLDRVAPAVDRVLGQQLARLKATVERR